MPPNWEKPAIFINAVKNKESEKFEQTWHASKCNQLCSRYLH